MKIYVACSSKEIDRAERVIEKLREAGITVSHDWTVPMRVHGPGNDGNVPDDVLLPLLRADMVKGVGCAEKLLYLSSTVHFGQGRFVELGGAFLTGVEIHVSGDVSKEPWARALGQRFHETDDDAIVCLTAASRRW